MSEYDIPRCFINKKDSSKNLFLTWLAWQKKISSYRKWYVSFIEVNLNLTVERKHFFKENKIYNCEFYQVFNVNNLQVENIESIDKNKKFNIDKEIDLQIFNDSNLTWKEVNSLKN